MAVDFAIPFPQIALHLLGILSFVYSFCCLSGIDNPAAKAFGWHFQHLTILGLLFSSVTFAISLARDIIPESVKVPHEVLTAVTVPLEGLISILYWSLLYYDERLLKQPNVAAVPLIVDLSFHLFPAIFLWADFLFFSSKFVRSPRHVAYILTFAVFYCGWAHLCYSRNGFWPYPLLDKLPTPYRLAFFVACAVFCTAVYETGALLHRFLNTHSKSLKATQ